MLGADGWQGRMALVCERSGGGDLRTGVLSVIPSDRAHHFNGLKQDWERIAIDLSLAEKEGAFLSVGVEQAQAQVQVHRSFQTMPENL